MSVISSSAELADLCGRLARAPFVTVDTEFIRESTFWPRLCLVQVAGPEDAVAIDSLAEGIDLAPLLELLAAPGVLKVFHSARQDIEIFYQLSGRVPAPLFDTQLAAMVCGFGESAAYETLVKKLVGKQVDKSSRFTDWARRPLSERQIKYALGDVTHLRGVYEKLAAQLEETGRSHWLDDEMALLSDPKIYEMPPGEAWQRIKTRSTNPRMLGILREAAGWRESEAQRRNVPRNRVVRDEALLEISAHPPGNPDELKRIRAFPRGLAEGAAGRQLLEAVARGKAQSEDELPQRERPPQLPRGAGPLVDLLKVLLKMKCEEHGVAQKLVANSSDLERIALDDEAQVAALTGWRQEVFGADALRLKRGELALGAVGKGICAVELLPSE
ncbi:MAG: ribonuclease D [Rhodospirillaceae bacterium]|nr:ribonuclease D [Rhodospirillaceae bacterium]